MQVLVDEAMPVQVIPPLRLNRRHEFDHVDELGWKGKADVQLFADAATRGYAAVLTLDLSQLHSLRNRGRSSARSAPHRHSAGPLRARHSRHGSGDLLGRGRDALRP